MEIIMMPIALMLSVGWAKLWISTYRPCGAGGFLRHTLLFLLLSAAVVWVVLNIIFSLVDESYSASNIGALGFPAMGFMTVFGSACLIALASTLGELITDGEDSAAETEDADGE